MPKSSPIQYKSSKFIHSVLLFFFLLTETSKSAAFTTSSCTASFRQSQLPRDRKKLDALVVHMKIPLEKLTSHANSYAAAHGLQVEVKGSASPSSSYQCAPISLLPNAFPSKAFQNAKSLAPHFNTLVERISKDGEFLTKTLSGGVVSNDPYTKKLLELYTDIYINDTSGKPNFSEAADALGIHRSDYMLNLLGDDISSGYGIKQVELNTIASSFAGLAVNVAGLHKMLTERYENDIKVRP